MNEVTERASKPKAVLTLQVTAGKRDVMRLASQMAGIAERKSTMPTLACVKLSAVDKRLTMEATDLYRSLVGSIDAEVGTPGMFAVAAKDFVDRVKAMPDGPLILEVKDNALMLKTKGSARRYTLRGMPGEDFPPMPQPREGSPELGVPAHAMRTLIARTHYAVSQDETRAHLNSALVEWEGERVRIVATDGHRLSMADATIAGRSATASMLLPLKAIHEIGRLCDEVGVVPKGEDESAAKADAAEIVIVQSGPVVFFKAGGLMLGVKTVDAQFPPYQQVIPKECARIATVPRAALVDAVRAVSVAASEKTGGVRIVLTKGKMKLTSESPDSGDGADEVDVSFDGPSLSIGCNAKYLVDALGSIADDEVEVGFGQELDPVLVKADGDSFLAVVMPMRI